MESLHKALRFRSWIKRRKKSNYIILKEDYILCAFKDDCQICYFVLQNCNTTTINCLLSEFSTVTIRLITWRNMGHGLHDGRNEMANVLQLGLWQIKDLIDGIKVKVPWTMFQQSLVSGAWRYRDGLGRQENYGGEERAVCEKPHHLAAQQENSRVVGREALQRSRDKSSITALLDGMLSC